MNENGLFNSSQHRFRAGRSCLSQLLDNFYSILEKLENGANVDVIYLDFVKAFDKVDIGIAIAKLKSMEFLVRYSVFLSLFLLERTQSACVNGCISKSHPVIPGVPQGSVLGLLCSSL